MKYRRAALRSLAGIIGNEFTEKYDYRATLELRCLFVNQCTVNSHHRFNVVFPVSHHNNKKSS